jgi:hypothetical protein
MSIWGCGSPASYCQPSAAAGFVYLEFSWMHAPFVYSPTCLLQLQSFFFNLEFAWGSAPFPLSSGVCHTLATIGSLPLSKHTGGGGNPLAFSGWLVYLQFHEGVPLLHFLELRAPCLLCYVSFFFLSCLFIIQFVFFSFISCVGVSLSRGLCWSGPGLFVRVPHAS